MIHPLLRQPVVSSIAYTNGLATLRLAQSLPFALMVAGIISSLLTLANRKAQGSSVPIMRGVSPPDRLW